MRDRVSLWEKIAKHQIAIMDEQDVVMLREEHGLSTWTLWVLAVDG